MHFVVFSLILALPLSYSIFFLSFCIWSSPKRSPEAMTLTAPAAIRALLNPPGTTTAILLHRRAVPNARLIRAFGIHNTFTSPSTNVHRVFRKHAMARLRALDHPDKWAKLKEVIHASVDFYLPDGSASGDYVTYVQAVVFVTVLGAFFDHTGPFPETSSVRFVTGGINTLWMSSKSPEAHSTSPILARINQYIHAWLPADPADPFRDNPLEIILPAYETLWRFVAHAFAYVEGFPKHALPFLDFFDSPTAAQFRASDPETPSVHEVLQEVLRLHPPTKRIKRVFHETPSSPLWIRRFSCDSACSNIVAADIEALQRSSVWGPSPHDFDALRHKASTEEQRESFMPFGFGPLKCVASTVAPRLTGLIVAGVATKEGIKLTRGGSQGSREGWGGWKIGKSGM